MLEQHGLAQEGRSWIAERSREAIGLVFFVWR